MPEQTAREKRIAARRAAVKSRTPQIPYVRVEPRDDDVRKYVKHPRGRAFPESGAVEWPADRFTRRRIADGSVKVAAETTAPAAPAAHASTPHAQHRREQHQPKGS